MKIILLLTLLLLISCRSTDTILCNIGNMDWDESEYIQAEKEDADLLISCYAEMNDSRVWKKEFYLKRTPVVYEYIEGVKTPEGDIIKPYRYRIAPRAPHIIAIYADGVDGYYNDHSALRNVTKNGFQLSLSFSSGDRKGKEISVEKSFKCSWLSSQEIQNEDIRLSVNIKENRTRQE